MAEHSASVEVGASVRAHRAARGLSLRALAAAVQVSPATVSAIETGKTPVTVDRLRQIAAVLAVPVSRLLDGGPVASVADHAGAQVDASADDWRTFAPLEVDAVLSASIRIFVARGFHAATMREIAGAMGVSVAGIYHHYASKHDILVALMDLTMSELTWRLQAARRDGGTPEQQFALMVESLALYHAYRADLAFLGASEMRGLAAEQLVRVTALRDDVQHALDEQAGLAFPHAPGVEVRTACRAIATMCTSLPSWFRMDGPLSAEEVARRYAGFALVMLREQRTEP